MLPTQQTSTNVQQTIKWLEKYSSIYSFPLSNPEYFEYFSPQVKAPQSDNVNFGLRISDYLSKNRLNIGGIIAFAPDRHDSIITIAERFMIPVLYIYPDHIDSEAIPKLLLQYPIYPYSTPFVTFYFTDIVTALSDAIPNFLNKELND